MDITHSWFIDPDNSSFREVENLPTKELVTGYPWQYNLLKIADNQFTVYTRRREELNGAWKPDARWLQGAGQEPLSYYAINLS